MYAYSLREKTRAARRLEDDVPPEIKQRRLEVGRDVNPALGLSFFFCFLVLGVFFFFFDEPRRLERKEIYTESGRCLASAGRKLGVGRLRFWRQSLVSACRRCLRRTEGGVFPLPKVCLFLEPSESQRALVVLPLTSVCACRRQPCPPLIPSSLPL